MPQANMGTFSALIDLAINLFHSSTSKQTQETMDKVGRIYQHLVSSIGVRHLYSFFQDMFVPFATTLDDGTYTTAD